MLTRNNLFAAFEQFWTIKFSSLSHSSDTVILLVIVLGKALMTDYAFLSEMHEKGQNVKNKLKYLICIVLFYFYW